MKNDNTKLKTIILTQGEIQDAMKHRVHKSKKTYTRKDKHKGREF
jgi:hypothetical protein